MGFKSDKQRHGFYGSQAVQSPSITDVQQKESPHFAQKLLIRARKTDLEHSEDQTIKRANEAEKEKLKQLQIRKLDEQEERVKQEILIRNQLKKGELDPRTLDKYEETSGLLPAKFKATQEKEKREFLKQQLEQNNSEFEELSATMKKHESELDEKTDAVGSLKKQIEREETPSEKIQLQFQLATRLSQVDDLKEESDKLNTELQKIRKIERQLQHASQSTAFGTAVGSNDPDIETLPKGVLRKRTLSKAEYEKLVTGKGESKAFPEGFKKLRFDPKSGKYTSRLKQKLVFVDGEPRYVIQKPETSEPTQDIKDEPPEESEMEKINLRINPRLTRGT